MTAHFHAERNQPAIISIKAKLSLSHLVSWSIIIVIVFALFKPIKCLDLLLFLCCFLFYPFFYFYGEYKFWLHAVIVSLLNRIVKGFRFPVHYFFSYFFAYSIFFQTFSSVGGFLNLGYSIYRYKQCCQKATNLSDKYFSPTNKIIIIITLFLIVFESVFKSGSYIYISFSFFFFPGMTLSQNTPIQIYPLGTFSVWKSNESFLSFGIQKDPLCFLIWRLRYPHKSCDVPSRNGQKTK